MSEQLLFVGTYAIPEDKFEEFRIMTSEMTEFVRANEPRIISWHTYTNKENNEATTIMLHPDSESLEYHLELAGSKIRTNVQMLETKRIELFGKPSDHLLDQLQRVSAMSGSWPVIVKGHLRGFSREQD